LLWIVLFGQPSSFARLGRLFRASVVKSSRYALHRACGFSWLARKILSTKPLPAKDDWL